MKIADVSLTWLGHAGFVIKGSKIIYIDPYNIKDGLDKADLILITHSHYDHCSIADIMKIVKDGTKIIMPADCQSKVTKLAASLKIEIIEPGKEVDYGNLRIIALPAYNVNKPFHPKEEEWVGYLIKLQNVSIYHAGDTDVIPEMQRLTGYRKEGREFVALLPVGGRFTMNAEEAAEAASIIKPDLAIPMHYGSIIGDESDALEFKELCGEKNINVTIMKKNE